MAQERCAIRIWSVLLVFLWTVSGVASQCSQRSGGVLQLRASKYNSDSIFSPGYPSNYDDDLQCKWSISTGDPTYVVRLRVISIDLEVAGGPGIRDRCSYDYIQVFDSSSIYGYFGSPILKFCTRDVYELHSTGEGMFIEFQADATISAGGFHLTYQAVHYSQVPRTTTVRYTTTETTTSFYSDQWRSSINTGALIGGLVGGLFVLFIFCALCRYYMRGNRSARMARTTYLSGTTSATSTSTTSQFSSPHTIYQNNNAVFMVTPPVGGSTQAVFHPGMFGGVTNLAYSSAGDAPPSYFSVQHSPMMNVQLGGMSPTATALPASAPPPSYTEAMMVSHPPSIPTTPSAGAAE